MTGYVIAPNPQASAAVAGTDERFPVRRIFCVGRNYAAHAREMGFSDKSLHSSSPSQLMLLLKQVAPFLIRRSQKIYIMKLSWFLRLERAVQILRLKTP